MLFVLSFFLTIALVQSCATTETEIKEVIKLEKKFGAIPTKPHYGSMIRLHSKKGFFCTGFVVDANYAVTAGHCLDAGDKLLKEEVKIYSAEGTDTGVNAKPAGISMRSDLGLLLGDFNEFKVAPADFHNWRLKPGTPFATCGFPYGDLHNFCAPFIPDTNYYFQVVGSGTFYPGQSGGPVVDLQDGGVVGVIVAVGNGRAYVSPLVGYLALFGLE